MIQVSNVCKSFDLKYQRDDFSLKEAFVDQIRRAAFWLSHVDNPNPPVFFDRNAPLDGRSTSKLDVLKSISLNIERGETVALIGRNGCGKSTLLKLLAGIYLPDSGGLSVTGRISPLIELGAGFHPEFSGRENILLNGQILGLSRAMLKDRMDEIIDFAELREFIDCPVRAYSSGMFMRLAFSVAVNVDPEILLIDEILAVGDASFQEKCYAKMEEFKRKKKTIVLVTHSLNVVESWANRAVYLKEGRIEWDGNPTEAVARYLADVDSRRSTQTRPAVVVEEDPLVSCEGTAENGLLRVFSAKTRGGILESLPEIVNEDAVVFRLRLSNVSTLSPHIVMRLFNRDHTVLISEATAPLVMQENSDDLHLKMTLHDLKILVGNVYHVRIHVHSKEKSEREIVTCEIEISAHEHRSGFVNLPLSMTLD